MFDFGWQEFMMIAFVLVLVVGPKDLPKVLRGFTKVTGQARQMAREFTRSLEDVAADSDMKDVKTMVSDLKSGNLDNVTRVVEDAVKPELTSAGQESDLSTIREDIESVKSAGRKATNVEAKKNAQIFIEAQEMLLKWEANDKDVINLWKKMNSWVYEGFDQTYKKLNVDFDSMYYESNTYLTGKDIVLEGLNKDIFFKKEDGSIWADLTNQGLDEKLLLRSDGTSVYITQDM